MSSENNNRSIPPKLVGKDETGRKTASSRPPEEPLKCPRCDSPNTKFCYYNNYSLSQPRHFCKTCRRYWTKGGALRNVPIGGGCRKSKKVKSTSSSRISSDSSSSSSEIGRLRLLQGLSPAMDFQLGGLSSFPQMMHASARGDISTVAAGTVSGSSFALDPSPNGGSLMGFNYSPVQEMGSMSLHSNLASSIESLSSINQDLHWKLQQQRLAVLYRGESRSKEINMNTNTNVSSAHLEGHQAQKPQPILFQHLDQGLKPEIATGVGSTRGDSGATATEWCFGSSYSAVNPTLSINSGNGNENGSNWNGVQAWSNMEQYSTLP